MVHLRINKLKILFITKFVLLGFLFVLFFTSNSVSANAGQMSMTAVYAGRGDAIIIESKGRYMLIDSGVVEQSHNLVSYLESKKISKIDYVISTHPDGDHVGGFASVFARYDIGEVFYSPCSKELSSYYNFIEALKLEGCPYSTPYNGQKWKLGDATIEVLYDGAQGSTYNECSIVLKVTCDGKSVLLMGDLPSTMENKLMNQGINFKSDVLKVGHHGASASSSASFLDAVSPSMAVISSSRDSGTELPKDSVLQRLARRQVKVYRTTDGNVTINFKNGNISTAAKENNQFVSIKKAKVTLNRNVFTYTGQEIKPAVTLSYDGVIVNPAFYTVSYSRNVNTGVGTVKISGTETKFVSSTYISFKILPDKEKIYSCDVSNYNNLKLKWSLQSHSSKYIVQYSKSKNFKTKTKTYTCSSSKTSKTLTGLSYNTKYYIRIRAYTNNVGFGKWSNTFKIKTEKKPSLEKVEITKCKLSAKHTIYLKWKKQKAATGYILEYSTDKRFKKYVKKYTIKKSNSTSFVSKKLKSRKTYYIRVRAYRNGMAKGKWSKVYKVST